MVWAELRTAELSETAKIWVIVPTYNEAENIQKLLRAILSLDLDLQVLVVDDQSPDGTADLIDSMDDPRARVLRRTGER
ncbi:MAG: glycosyltransferase, partial [Candidatus Omnitrophica bacterium]|nr:glycosyltransferase [Candidatus Omnitrophota bacterium]